MVEGGAKRQHWGDTGILCRRDTVMLTSLNYVTPAYLTSTMVINCFKIILFFIAYYSLQGGCLSYFFARTVVIMPIGFVPPRKTCSVVIYFARWGLDIFWL